MRLDHLPIHLKIERPTRIGHEDKGIFFLTLFGLILSCLQEKPPDLSTILIFCGGMVLGLGIWITKKRRYRGQKFEVMMDAYSITFSRILLIHPRLWPQFCDGLLVRIPWTEIKRWDVSELDHYALYIRSTPGKVLILDREPLLEVENRFIPHAQQILLENGKGY